MEERITMEIDSPYPLRRNFNRFILPAFAVLVLLVPGLAGWGGASLIENVYLQLAQGRAEVIDRAMGEETRTAWLTLKSTKSPQAFFSTPRGKVLHKALLNEVEELALVNLKIYGQEGVILFDTHPETIGNLDPSPAYNSAWREGKRTAVRKALEDGSALYELYVRLPGERKVPPVVFEMYEQTAHLNTLLLGAAAPVAVASALLLIGIMWGLSRLVGRAQEDIEKRTALLAELRARIEGFVSDSAVNAARKSLASGDIRSERLEMTLLYSDVRDFTGFSEGVEPEEVVAFLNWIMGVQIEIVGKRQGDVDKMIGDALLVRFEGADRERRAILAAADIQARVTASNMPRGIGIGVFSGTAISGVIGPAGRQDFTVIGDSVNAVARLCSAAKAGEVVSDVDTLVSARVKGFGPEEEITVKGKTRPLAVRRWRPVSAS